MIIDTMVFAYALLGVEEYREQAVEALSRADSIQVPDLLFSELTNVVWQWVRFRGVPLEKGQEILADAGALVDQILTCDVLWERALALAAKAAHPAYDAMFIAAAELTDTKLLTFDAKLLQLFPEQTLDAGQR